MELKEKRLKSNLKIKGICEALEISRSTYYLIEKGKRKLKKCEAEKLNKIFNNHEEVKI